MFNLRRITARYAIVGSLTAAVAMCTVLIGSPAQAAGDNHGKDAVRTCGIATCSLYYSHNATVRINDLLHGPADTTDAMAISGGVCLGAGLLLPITAIPCTALGFVALGDWRVRAIIDHAATTNGCIRFRTIRGADNTPGPIYSDHSTICHSMD